MIAWLCVGTLGGTVLYERAFGGTPESFSTHPVTRLAAAVLLADAPAESFGFGAFNYTWEVDREHGLVLLALSSRRIRVQSLVAEFVRDLGVVVAVDCADGRLPAASEIDAHVCSLLATQLADVDDAEVFLAARPVEPLPEECCGTGCSPCVYDRYDAELGKWERVLDDANALLLELQMLVPQAL